MTDNTRIEVENGGSLTIDAGILSNVSIVVKRGGRLSLANGSKIILSSGSNFKTEVGAIINITQGQIIH